MNPSSYQKILTCIIFRTKSLKFSTPRGPLSQCRIRNEKENTKINSDIPNLTLNLNLFDTTQYEARMDICLPLL